MNSYNKSVQLMDTRRIHRTLKRMSLEILEDAGGPGKLVLGGINERGLLLAEQIKKYVFRFEEQHINIVTIDENGNNGANIQIKRPVKWKAESYFVLIDDVIFSGRTMYSALQTISQHQLPDEICAAVLIDRGHRRVPIHPRYTGMHIPTKFKEHITVDLTSSKNNVKLHTASAT